MMKMMRWGAALLFLLPAAAFAGEDCSLTGGVCKDRCGAGEEVLIGAFMDCTDKQDCCAKKDAAPAASADGDQRGRSRAEPEKK